MSLYDNIRCKHRLPDGFSGELQTKDLGQSMLTHEITEDGRLMIANGFIQQDGDLVESDFTGNINFYGSVYYHEDGTLYRGRGVLWSGGRQIGDDGKLLRHEWHEYDATFQNGRLVEIRQVSEAE